MCWPLRGFGVDASELWYLSAITITNKRINLNGINLGGAIEKQ